MPPFTRVVDCFLRGGSRYFDAFGWYHKRALTECVIWSHVLEVDAVEVRLDFRDSR